MQCRDVREMADSFLSEELLTETNHEILRHVDTCPVCRADLDARRGLRATVQRAFRNASDLDPSTGFAERMRTTLHETAHVGPTRRGLRIQGRWALAASLLIAVALGLAWQGRNWSGAAGALARAAVGDHRNCALQFRLTEKPIPLEEAAQRYDAAYRVLETLPPTDLMTAAGPAHVVERHACVYGGRRFAHIVLQYRGVAVSLLVTAVDRTFRVAGADDRTPQLTAPKRIDGVSVLSFRVSGHMVLLAGDLEPARLMQLAEAVAGPLHGRLAGG